MDFKKEMHMRGKGQCLSIVKYKCSPHGKLSVRDNYLCHHWHLCLSSEPRLDVKPRSYSTANSAAATAHTTADSTGGNCISHFK